MGGTSSTRADIAVIGGSGFYTFFDDSDAVDTVETATPYGAPSGPIAVGSVSGRRVAFLARHGPGHEFSAHSIPYRANLWALRSLGVRAVLGPVAVGSLTEALGPGALVVPDQLVDRTSGRTQTYFDSGAVHVEFADPYSEPLRQAALTGARQVAGRMLVGRVIDGGTMVVIDGPRFSTRAESRWYAAQGWTLVNMTGHPEAVLARELEMAYAAIALVTDTDAGVQAGGGVRAVDVFAEFARNIGPFKATVRAAIAALPADPAEYAVRVHDGVKLPIELP